MALRVALAYSGGLDTSVIARWLIENYDAEVVCVAVDVGQPGGLAGLREKALATGAVAFHGVDAREAFVSSFVWPTLRAGAVYGRKYLLGTSMARPLIARRQVEVARAAGANAVSHGCTGKGNDQVRFELTYRALAPDLQVIAPWREWDLASREDALAYARARGIGLTGVDEEKLYSCDENLWHISYEGGPLEDPTFEPEKEMFLWSVSPMDAPDEPEHVEIGFEEGYPVAVDGMRLDPVELLMVLNAAGGRHGVGRADIIEDRLVGMKSRGVYETPGGTILYAALRELEELTLHRRSIALKDLVAERYADLVYEGRWWTPEREAIDALVDVLMRRVTGSVTMELYKGSARGVSRTSPKSLYDGDLASFGESGSGDYDHGDAAGFIRLFSLSLEYPEAGEEPDDR
jgi:argininosuccinate synthase